MTKTLVAIALVAWMSGAVAAKPDAATIKKANAHLKLGQEFFKTEQWDRAIVEYQAALDLTGEPSMVFNIALANDRAGRPEMALAGFLKYLELESEGSIADEARQDVSRLTPIVDKIHADAAAEEARKVAEAKRLQDDAAKRDAAAKAAEAAKADALGVRVQAVETHGSHQRIGGVAIMGAGAIAIGFGFFVFGLEAHSISNELEGHRGPWTDAQIARDADGHSANLKMIVLSAAGGAAIIGGGVLYLMGRSTQHRADEMRLDVHPTAGGVAASFEFRF